MHSLAGIILIGWLLFWTYWFIMAASSKKNKSTRVRQFMGLRIVILIVAILIIRPFDHQNGTFKNHYLATDNRVVLLTGFIMFLLGLFLAIWARIYLGKNWGMPMSEKQEPELVTSGPYKYIRHPIYTGILLAVLGSVLGGSIYWLLMLAFSAPYFIYSAFEEEKIMIKQFPKAYSNYKSKSKMLIPFIF